MHVAGTGTIRAPDSGDDGDTLGCDPIEVLCDPPCPSCDSCSKVQNFVSSFNSSYLNLSIVLLMAHVTTSGPVQGAAPVLASGAPLTGLSGGLLRQTMPLALGQHLPLVFQMLEN